MEEFEIQVSCLFRLVKITLEQFNNKVEMEGNMSHSFETAVGLRQGHVLSTLLFNLCMETIERNVEANLGGTIFIRRGQCLLFADDVAVLGYALKQ
jgi:hypothetical protein